MANIDLQDIKRLLKEISQQADDTSKSLSKLKIDFDPGNSIKSVLSDFTKLTEILKRTKATDVTPIVSSLSAKLRVEVAKRKAELAAVMKQYARGPGRFTEEGIRGGIERQLLGTTGDRTRIGGGQYVSQSQKAQAEIKRLTAEILLLNKAALRSESLGRLNDIFNNVGSAAQQAAEQIRAAGTSTEKTDEGLKETLFPTHDATDLVTGTGPILGDLTKGREQAINTLDEYIKKLEEAIAKEKTLRESKDKPTGKEKELSGLVEGAEKTRIALKNLSERGFANLETRMAAADVSWKNLKRVAVESSTGIQTYSFRVKEAEGYTRELNVTLDKTGAVLQDRQRRFSGFFQGIQRNFVEGLKWTVAIGLIYGPINKLQEVIQESIKNEAELARIGTILGKSTEDLGRVFDTAAIAAEAASESISGVLEGYTLAFRATGKYEDATVRNAMAATLLRDSLTLSKLSTLDQASALDTLVGALSQTGKELNQGKELLNSWVAVTKIANVDLKTLAESFAITSTSAENAGISFDELNGIIATVAEKTTLSATEAGNAVRAFISGIQTDKAVGELANFGIAVTDMNGEARDFMEIIRDIYNLFEDGVISDTQLNKISEAIGGGARRGAQVATFIKSYERVGEVAAASARAIGDSDDALARQSDTVESALTRLNNSLVILGQALGEEGGVLNGLKNVIGFLDTIIDGLTNLIEVTGKTIPALTALGITFSAFNRKGYVTPAIEGISGKIATAVTPLANIASGMLGVGGTTYRGTTSAQEISSKLTAAAPKIGGAIAIGFLAAMNAGKGNWQAAGANVAGSIIGALVSGGNPVGAIIGATIGETLVKYLQTHPIEPGEFEQYLAGKAEKDIRQTRGIISTDEIFDPTKDLGEELYKFMDDVNALTSSAWRNTLNTWSTGIQNLFRGSDDKIEPPQILDAYLEELNVVIQSLEQLQSTGTILPQQEETLQKALELREKINQTQADLAVGVNDTVEAEIRSNETLEKYRSTLQQVRQEEIARARDLLNAGQITSKQFKELTAQNTDTLSARIFDELKASLGDTADVFAKVTRATIVASPEDIDYLASLLTEISNIRGEIKAGTAENINVAKANLDQTVSDLNVTVNRLYENAVRLSAVPTKDIVKLPEIDLSEFQLVLQRAREIYVRQIQGQVAAGIISAHDAEEVINAAEEFAVELGGYIYENVSGATAEALKDAIKELEEEGKINVETETSDFGIQRIDATQEQFWAAYNQMAAFIKERFSTYEFKEEDLGAIFRNDVTEILHVDNLIMQLAMQELIEVNKKQLDGIYNLPSGASFYVPLQAYEMHRETLAASEAALENVVGAVQVESKDPFSGAVGDIISDITRLLQIREDEPTMLARIDDLISQITRALENNPELATELRDLLPQISETYGADIANELAKFLPATDSDKLEQLKDAINSGNSTTSANLDKLYSTMLAVRDINANGFVMVTNAINGLRTTAPTTLTPTTVDLTSTPTIHDIPDLPTLLDKSNESAAMQNAIQTTLNFNLNMHSETQLIVDGKVLSDIVKDYLYQDMERLESTSTTLSVSVI